MSTEKNRVSEIDSIKLDLTNEEFNNAVDFVQHTNRLVYLTGKAGTGKTTYYQEKYGSPCSNRSGSN